MAIKVIANKKLQDDGSYTFTVLEVQALSQEQLPKEYLNNEPNTYKLDDFLKLFPLPSPYGITGMTVIGVLKEGVTYPESQFSLAITYLKAAGDRLLKVKKELKGKKSKVITINI